MRVENSTFVDNISGDDGAGITGRRVNVEINESFFKRNKAIAVGVALTDPIFTEGLVTSTGGATSIQNEYVGNFSGDQSYKVTVRNSVINDNKSPVAAGFFIMGTPGSKTLIDNTRFLNNGGSGVVTPDSPPNEVGVRFGRGAAALLLTNVRGGDREIDENNNFVRSVHNARILDSYFSNNEAINSDGGAIQNASAPVVFYAQVSGPEFYPANLNVKNSLFFGNSTIGEGSGGAISNGGNQLNGSVIDPGGYDRRADVDASELTVNRSTFYAISAVNNGGAIANWNSSSLKVKHTIIEWNSASTGGGISVIGHEVNQASYKEHGTWFDNNIANDNNSNDLFIINAN